MLGLLAAGVGAAATGLAALGRRMPQPVPVTLNGPSAGLGHRLRSGGFPPPGHTERTHTVIVGGGIAGLAAARALHRAGRDFLLLELETAAGGNARCGANPVSAYPLGAHYVPLVGSGAVEVRALYEELGLIVGEREGLPVYDDLHLCHDPQERLLIEGRWQEGLLPQRGVSGAVQDQYRRFFEHMEAFRCARGRDGLRAFEIPVDRSSRDPAYTALDRLSMAAWLHREGYDAAPLLWYVDYCCRDDYGAPASAVSAWAGIHYHAARDGLAANADREAVLTWPEGNHWLVQRLAEGLERRLRSGALVHLVEDLGDAVLVDYYDPAAGRSLRVLAERAIVCTPRFVTHRIVPQLGERIAAEARAFQYGPWLVANLTVDSLPGGPGAATAWDNVPYQGGSLGYVVATHQSLHPMPTASVLTYYRPLDHLPPAAARREALTRSRASWHDLVLRDLDSMHPGARRHVRHIELWLWGHGMIRPNPGFLWGPVRLRAAEPLGRIRFAHSDLSGISIFEEAYIRGLRAAAVAG